MHRRPFLLLAIPLALAACTDAGEDASGGGGSAPAVRDIDVSTGAELATDDAYRIIDVRTPAEFGAGHLARAENIDIQDTSFEERIGALPREGRYLVYCRSGNRSTQATTRMRAMGFTDLTNVTGGGFTELQAAGAPVA